MSNQDVGQAVDPEAAAFFGCAGKAGHSSRRMAAMILKRMVRRRKSNAGLEVYRCRRCGDWHIGNNISRLKAPRGSW